MPALRLILIFSIFLPFMLTAETIHNGVVDLSSQHNRDRSVAITGRANFYWQKFLTVSELDTATPSTTIKLPGTWNNLVVDGTKIEGTGYATIALTVIADQRLRNNLAILVPPIFSSYRLYVDSTLISQCGDAQKKPEATISSEEPHLAEFSISKDTVQLIFQISNFTNNQGGPWQTMYIGNSKTIHRLYQKHKAYDIALLGGLIAFGLVFFLRFFMIRHDHTRTISLWFALFCSMLFIRLLTTGTNSIYFLIPSIPSSMVKHLEYVSFFLTPLFYQSYVHILFERISSKLVMVTIRYVTLVLCGISLLTPQLIHSTLVLPFQIFVLLVMFYHIYLSAKSFRTDHNNSIMLSISTMILLVTVFHDIVQGYGYGFSIPLVPLGGVSVAMLHAYFVARNSHIEFTNRNTAEQELSAINRTLASFVPTQFFDLLEQTPATITIGTQIQEKMAVAFCSIRNFKELSIKMNNEEKFNLISSFLREVTPVFYRHGGFIDKYIGDSVMVIFPKSAENAIRSALELMAYFHSDSVPADCKKVQIGIGIHYGPMTLGVIGADQRIENTVIGNAVNTASRMQSLTQKFGSDLIVSSEVLGNERFENEIFHLRSLGTLAVKGKRERTTIHEIFHVPDGKFSPKLESRNSFEQAVVFYESGHIQLAETFFNQSLSLFPNDLAAKAFLTGCQTGNQRVLTTK